MGGAFQSSNEGESVIAEVNIRFTRRLLVVSRWAGFLVMAMGGIVLAGWTLRSPAILMIFPRQSPMTPWTAVCFVLYGIALLGSQEGGSDRRQLYLRTICIWSVVFLAALVLVEYVFKFSAGIDTLLFASALNAFMPQFPGRMSPLSTLGFLLSGMALANLDMKTCRGSRPGQGAALCVGVLALLGLLGYAYGIDSFYKFSFYKPMALHTAIAFMLLAIGLLSARPSCGFMTVFVSDSEGGIMARRLLLFAVAAPFLLGLLLLEYHRLGWYDVTFAFSLLIFLIIVVFTAVIWINAISLHRIDLKRLRIEQMLRENEDKYRTIFETAGSAMAIFEEDRTISLVNTEFEKLSGFAREDIETRKSWEEFVANDVDLKKMREYHRQRRVEPFSAPRTYEFKFIDRYGMIKDIFMTVAMIPATTKSIASLMDITERKRIERMKSDFVSLVSHQLKTPVAEINGYVFNLLTGIAGALTPKQREYLEEMQEISGKNYRLISDLLNVSRLERGVISMDIRPVAVKDLVEMSLQDYYERLKKQNLVLQLGGLEQEIFVNADKEKVIEVIGNVLNNAIKFTSQGTIGIVVTVKEDTARISISDTGAGIPPHRLEKLFTKDQMLEGGPVAGGGAGLGLYIAKQFMLLQKGDITVVSQVGKGTTFEISLPIADQ